MKLRMICLAPGCVAPGMTLASAAMDQEGRVLLAEGTVLDHATLDRLSRRGIEAIAVLVPDTRDAETIAQELRLVESRVAQIFRGSGSAARQELQASVLGYRRESTR